MTATSGRSSTRGPCAWRCTAASAAEEGGATAVFRVEDLEAARWQLESRGVRFDDHVGEVPGFARFATFRDPDGNALQLIEYVGRLILSVTAPPRRPPMLAR